MIAYTAWSLLDNFEWAAGYTEKFGLHYVDFNDPERPRTPKDSAGYYAQLIRDNGFVEPEVDVCNVSSYSLLLLTICFTIFMLH